jgi:hypothetical protein
MSLEELLLRSEIVCEPVGTGEIARLLAAVKRRLDDATLEGLHPETRLEQAYLAILNCAVIALRANGLRAVDRPGHHLVALKSLADTLGMTTDRIDYFQTLCDLRNKDIYSGSSHVSPEQAAEAVEEARRLAQETADWLRKGKKRPEDGARAHEGPGR